MFIGLDLGTSGLKALLMDVDQAILGEASAPLSVARPNDGWSEQAPADWIAAAEIALDALAGEHDLSGVEAIGLSGQMHGATLLDASDQVLRPCILWNDTRSAAQAAAMDADPDWRAITGNIVFPGFTAPKLHWVREVEPDTFRKVAKVLLPKDYLRLWLTGEHVSDMSDSAGTSWMDTGARDWSDDLLARSDLSRDHMPRLVEGAEVSGALRGELAHRWGMRAVPVAGGAGDNAAAAIGTGVVQAGQAFVSLGTSGVLFAANDGYAPDAARAVHTFCHALPATWHQMGVVLAATDALNWFAALAGSDAQALTADLGDLQPPGKTLFLPYLGGERTPLNDAAIRGAFIGLDHATDRAAATRAVLEGVTFALRDSRDALAATGTRFDSLLAVGGGSRSDYWLQAIATAFDMPVDLPVAGDFGAAFGAARLAQMAATGGGAELAPPPKIARRIAPQRDLTQAFTEGHARYAAARTAIKGLT